MRRLRSSLSDNSNKNRKTPYLDVILLGIIQFLLSVLILSYGVFLMQFVEANFCDLKTGLWTVIAYVTTSKITSPWVKSYCKHLDNIRHKVYKRNIIATVFVLFIDFVIASLLNRPLTQIILYGVFGGLLSSLIFVHLEYATSESFRGRSQIFNISHQITKPLSLIFMPHMVLFLTDFYGVLPTQLIMSAFILNIIPICLLIREKNYRPTRLCKFQTRDRLSIEMIDLTPKVYVTHEASSSSDEEDEDLEVDKNENNKSEPSSPEPVTNCVQKYYENVGVKILPNIPEEDETDEEDDINEISTKRLSRISAILQELNENSPKLINSSSTNLFFPDEVTQYSEPENVDNERFLNEVGPKRFRCFSFNSDMKYVLNVKKNKAKSFIYKKFVRSVVRTLSTIYFYPTLISNCITTLMSTIVLATTPCLFSMKTETKTIDDPRTPEENIFLLTIIGLTWLFFLAGYPVFSNLTPLRTKILFLIGLSVSGLSLWKFSTVKIIPDKFKYDNLALFSLTFGLGHGIITYSEKVAHENFFGKERWIAIQGALEISTGCIVILAYLIIYYNNYLKINVLLSYAYWFYIFDVVLWITAYIIKFIIIRIKNVRHYNVQKYPNFDD